ncbi:MAG: CBS domain-containing protein [Bacteroidota bacterium]
MNAEQLINYMVPPLKPTDDIVRAKQWLEEFRIQELPVVHDKKLVGFITDQLLYDVNIAEHEVGNYPLVGHDWNVSPKTHYLDILRELSQHNIGCIAVVNESEFLGVAVLNDILKEFGNTAIVNSSGAIITLRTMLSNYSLSEISKTVEMNESMILGCNIMPDINDPAYADVTLRINHQDVGQICAMLSGQGYEVTSSLNTENNAIDEEKRLGLLMKYLEP